MSSETPAPERIILTIETLGHEQLLCSEAAARILGAAEIDADDWVTTADDGKSRFLDALNHILSSYLAKKLVLETDRQQRKELRKMRSYLEAYMKAARSLKHASYPPPYMPRLWFDQAMTFYDDLEAQFKDHSSGGRKKATAEWEFIGQCAALFSISFNLEPTSVAPGVRQETGAFSKFFLAIQRECRRRLINPETEKQVLPNYLHRRIFLANDTEDRLRALITKALNYQKSYSDVWKIEQGDGLYWVGYKELIQDVYVRGQASPGFDLKG